MLQVALLSSLSVKERHPLECFSLVPCWGEIRNRNIFLTFGWFAIQSSGEQKFYFLAVIFFSLFFVFRKSLKMKMPSQKHFAIITGQCKKPQNGGARRLCHCSSSWEHVWERSSPSEVQHHEKRCDGRIPCEVNPPYRECHVSLGEAVIYLFAPAISQLSERQSEERTFWMRELPRCLLSRRLKACRHARKLSHGK